MEHNTNEPILSKRTLISTLLITFGSVVLLGVVMVSSFTPCISNYYDLMIVHPDATPISEKSDIANYFGFGEISNTFFVPEDADVVQAWYRETVAEAEWERHEDLMARVGEIRPWWKGEYKGIPLWGGSYAVSPTDDGAEVILSANCFE